MSKIKRFVNDYIPIFAVICFSLAFIFWIILQISKANVGFAETLSASVGAFFRTVLSYITYPLPFSLAEIMLILVPLAITVLIIVGLRRHAGLKHAVRYLLCIAAAISLIYPVYVLTLGVGYHRESVSSKLAISADAPTEDELYRTLMTVSGCMDELLDEIDYLESGASYTDLSVDEISALISESYETVNARFDGLSLDTFNQRAKPVIMSKGMTYLELLGIYSFFTGESNVNVHYPDYTLPFSVAHEFAHARGIARENEANFIAFLVCINASDPYIKYSGYLNMYEYLASALGKTNKNLLKNIYAMTDARVMSEIYAYSDFFYANQIEFLGDVSDFFNDKYLKAQGTEGIVSYGLAVRLCVGYYEGTQ